MDEAPGTLFVEKRSERPQTTPVVRRITAEGDFFEFSDQDVVVEDGRVVIRPVEAAWRKKFVISPDGLDLVRAGLRETGFFDLPAEYSAALQLETKDGNITIQYPEQTVEGEKIPWMVITRKKARSLGASVGEGGAPLKLHTAVGQVHVSTLEAP